MSYQLQGSLYRDLMVYDRAYHAFVNARAVAKELGDHELFASAMARHGVTLIQQGEPYQAIHYLNKAMERTEKGHMPALRGYIGQALSEAYAHTGEAQQSWRTHGATER